MTDTLHPPSAPAEEDLSAPVELSDGIFWVGAGPHSVLSRNIYLRVFRGAGKTANLIIDPGPPLDLDVLVEKVNRVIGNVAKVNMVFANHQDPDVVANVTYLAKINPRATFVATEDTWRLVSLYGLPPQNFRAVERFRNGRAVLPTGHRLQFVPTPFCHFRGACMLYDLESRILFTGDLLGGVLAGGLWASRASWSGIKAFHQLYMPSNEALRLAVQRIRALDPVPIMLAPQHGGLIRGELMEELLGKLADLPVGLDIITSLRDSLPQLVEAVNEVLDHFRAAMGEQRVEALLGSFRSDGSYPALLTLDKEDRVLGVPGDPREGIEALLKTFFRPLDEQRRAGLMVKILRAFLDRNLPPPDALLGQEGGQRVEFIEDDA